MGKQAEGNGPRRRQRRALTPEFKAEVIVLVRRASDRCQRSIASWT